MDGLSNKAKDAIAEVVENLFDNVALQLLGNIPKLKGKKFLAISGKKNMGLAHLFVQALGNKAPNSKEQDLLGSLLNSAYGYIESLKGRTRANIAEHLDGFIREKSLKGESVSGKEIQDILDAELSKAKSHMLTISESEATKLRNLGTMMDIVKVAATVDDEDPTVLFLCVHDKDLCKECERLHLMPDKMTPRLYKISELKQGYHKRGDDRPSVYGLHPHDRCVLAFLPRSFGYNERGKIEYHSPGYDAYAEQRKPNKS